MQRRAGSAAEVEKIILKRQEEMEHSSLTVKEEKAALQEMKRMKNDAQVPLACMFAPWTGGGRGLGGGGGGCGLGGGAGAGDGGSVVAVAAMAKLALRWRRGWWRVA